MLAKRSAIDKSVKKITRATASTSPMDVTPCTNRIISWKLPDLLGLRVNICNPMEKHKVLMQTQAPNPGNEGGT